MTSIRYDNVVPVPEGELVVANRACRTLDVLSRLKRCGEKHEAEVEAVGRFTGALEFLKQELGRNAVREFLRQNLMSIEREASQ